MEAALTTTTDSVRMKLLRLFHRMITKRKKKKNNKHFPIQQQWAPVAATQSLCLHSVLLFAADTHAHRTYACFSSLISEIAREKNSELDANKTKHGQLNDFQIETHLCGCDVRSLSISFAAIFEIHFPFRCPTATGGYLGPRLCTFIYGQYWEWRDGRQYRSILSE